MKYTVNAYNTQSSSKKPWETKETDSLRAALVIKENYDTWYVGIIAEIIDNETNEKVETKTDKYVKVEGGKIWFTPFDYHYPEPEYM